MFNVTGSNEKMLVDFTTMQTLHGWVEISDVLRNIGKSKAVLSLQKTHKFQRAVLFTMLNPQPGNTVNIESTLRACEWCRPDSADRSMWRLCSMSLASTERYSRSSSLTSVKWRLFYITNKYYKKHNIQLTSYKVTLAINRGLNCPTSLLQCSIWTGLKRIK